MGTFAKKTKKEVSIQIRRRAYLKEIVVWIISATFILNNRERFPAHDGVSLNFTSFLPRFVPYFGTQEYHIFLKLCIKWANTEKWNILSIWNVLGTNGIFKIGHNEILSIRIIPITVQCLPSFPRNPLFEISIYPPKISDFLKICENSHLFRPKILVRFWKFKFWIFKGGKTRKVD